MKQATTHKKMVEHWSVQIDRRLREACFILLCSLAVYFLMALVTYHQTDPAWSQTGMSYEIQNAAGRAGAYIADILFSLFGYFAFGFVPFLLGSAFLVIRYLKAKEEQPNRYLRILRGLGVFIILLSGCSLLDLCWGSESRLPMGAGGLLGSAITFFLSGYFSLLAASFMLLAWFLIGVHLYTGFSWLQSLKTIGKWSLMGLKYCHRGKTKEFVARCHQMMQLPLKGLSLPTLWKGKTKSEDFSEEFSQADQMSSQRDPKIFQNTIDDDFIPEAEDNPFVNKKSLSSLKEKIQKRSLNSKQMSQTQDEHVISAPSLSTSLSASTKVVASSSVIENHSNFSSHVDHNPPSLTLLEIGDKTPANKGYSPAQLQALSRLVETRLAEFGVEVNVVGVLPGPVITRFELDLAAGLKVSKITSLAKDLARSLSVISVRVVEVIPGKSVVGLEIPNTHREMVRLKAVLEDPAYQQSDSPLSMALGKDIAGKPMVVDLARMPHLLVAGTTGSGKSVGLNAMLLSILYKSTPDEVRLILIDPKMLELAVYDHIPHLLTPVVTDMKDAANALRWCVGEMERRYQLMAALGVRNLAGYNQRIANAKADGKPLLDPFWEINRCEKPEPLEHLPYVVVVIDEFADMIMVVGKKVEELIARIAQKARAAGIHLILATQRPSVDVITGLIKANIPTRIAFQVSSRIDSRTILDQSGAEQLLGHGDMLYLPPGSGVPHRIHGAFVSDDEVHKVTQALRKSAKPAYIENLVEPTSSLSMQEFDGEADELYDQAVAIVLEAKKASISLVQRRLKIGYNRAARLVEQMEASGLVSAVQSNGLREVLAPNQD